MYSVNFVNWKNRLKSYLFVDSTDRNFIIFYETKKTTVINWGKKWICQSFNVSVKSLEKLSRQQEVKTFHRKQILREKNGMFGSLIFSLKINNVTNFFCTIFMQEVYRVSQKTAVTTPKRKMIFKFSFFFGFKNGQIVLMYLLNPMYHQCYNFLWKRKAVKTAKKLYYHSFF